jgi:hypothetical protein
MQLLRSSREICTTQNVQPNTPELEAQLKHGFNLFMERENRRLTDAKPMRLIVKHTFYTEVQSSYMGRGSRLTHPRQHSNSEVMQLYVQRVFRRPNSAYY